MEEILTHAAVILDGELVREAPLEDYLGRADTWTVRVKDEAAARGAVEGIGSMSPSPDTEGRYTIEAGGLAGDELAAKLVGAGAGVLHFAEARIGLQASFEALVEERRQAMKAGGAS
jgi:hypothetical protein